MAQAGQQSLTEVNFSTFSKPKPNAICPEQSYSCANNRAGETSSLPWLCQAFPNPSFQNSPRRVWHWVWQTLAPSVYNNHTRFLHIFDSFSTQPLPLETHDNAGLHQPVGLYILGNEGYPCLIKQQQWRDENHKLLKSYHSNTSVAIKMAFGIMKSQWQFCCCFFFAGTLWQYWKLHVLSSIIQCPPQL